MFKTNKDSYCLRKIQSFEFGTVGFFKIRKHKIFFTEHARHKIFDNTHAVQRFHKNDGQ